MRGFALTIALVCTLCAASAQAQVSHAVGEQPVGGNRPASVGRGMLLPVQYEAGQATPEPAAERETATENSGESLKLPERSASLSRIDSPRSKGPAGALGTVVGSLAIVIGLFLLVVWVTRRAGPRSAQLLPTEAVEVLGRAPLPGKQHMQLLRVGRKLVLVCATAGGMETLTEVTDPTEVDRLTAICQQNSSKSISGTFSQVLTNLNEEEPVKKGRLGREARALARSRQREFQSTGVSWEGGDA